MKKANNVLRRSSVKLKSLSGGNADLQLIISQIKDVKSSFKSFMDAQEVLAEDMYAWSQKLDNEAIQSSFSCMLQISSLWTEAQKMFYETLRKYKEEFELILEGDKHVSQAKKLVDAQEEMEVKAKRELQKATKKGCLQDIEVLRAKANQAEKTKEGAKIEFTEKLRENEAVRMIRVKGSSMKLSSAYHEMATKCCSLFHAHHLVAQEIPDVHGKELHNARFRVNACRDHLQRAKEQVLSYRKESIKHPNTHGPQASRRSSQASSRSEDPERNHSHPATAPNQSLSSSLSSVGISSSPNVQQPTASSPSNQQTLNNFNTDRSNEKYHYEKISRQPNPPEQHSTTNDEATASIDHPSRGGTPPPYNPYFVWNISNS